MYILRSICPVCEKTIFNIDNDDTPTLPIGFTGVDLPDKACPSCGRIMDKAGFNLPYETLLGFYGNKEPDFDVNVAADHQDDAIRCLCDIEGIGGAYRPVHRKNRCHAGVQQ